MTIKRLLFIISLIVSGFLCVHAETVSVNQFGGLNTDDNPLTLIDGKTPDSENVVTDNGPSLEGRNGFVTFSTETTKDLWEFPLSDGTRYLITHSSDTLKATTGGSNFNIYVSSVAPDIQTVATVLGDRFYFANTVDGLKYWDGTSVVVASASLTVDKLVTHKGRLWAAGLASAQRTIFASEFLDGTNWTIPADPVDTDPAQIVISGSLDENIQALYSSFQDKIMWFKSNSFGAIFGSRRSNFIQRTFSDTVGITSKDSAQDCDGLLRWLGPRREVFEFNGQTYGKISEDIDGFLDTISQGDSVSKSNTQTTQSDWEDGTVQDGYLSTDQIIGTINLTSTTVSAFEDTSQSDFEAGTLTNLDSTTTSGSLILDTSTVQVSYEDTGGSGSGLMHASDSDAGQAFTAPSGLTVTGLQIRTARVGTPGNGTIYLLADSSGEPGSILASKTRSFSSDSTSFDWISVTLDTPILISSGTQYWVALSNVGPDSSNTVSLERCDGVGCTTNGDTYCSDAFGEGVGPSCNTTVTMIYRVDGWRYDASGDIVSQTFDMGFDTTTWLWQWGTFSATSTLNGETINYETQTSSNSTDWFDLTTATVGTAIGSPIRQYIRYKASFESDRGQSPQLDGVSLNIGIVYRSTGTYITEVINVGDNISSWGSFGFNEIDDQDEITYDFNASTESAIDDFGSGWETVTQGAVPTIATAPYAAARFTFVATTGTTIPRVEDITINWTEGSTIRTASAYTNQRYWLAVAVSSTNNNRVLVYDKNRHWQLYTGINADTMRIYNTTLRFGNGSGTFTGETGYSDNGTDITAYYKTKLFAPSGLDAYSLYDYIYLTTENSDSTIGTDYQVENIDTDYSLGSRLMNVQAGVQNFKVPFYQTDVQQSKFIDMKWTVTGSAFWRLINANLYYQPGLAPD